MEKSDKKFHDPENYVKKFHDPEKDAEKFHDPDNPLRPGVNIKYVHSLNKRILKTINDRRFLVKLGLSC